jgi:hypothetical protein
MTGFSSPGPTDAGSGLRTLHLWPETPEPSRFGVRRSCRIDRRDGDAEAKAPERLWFEFEAPRDGASADAEPFAVAMLPQALRERRDLVVHGAVSRRLLRNLSELSDVWHCWLPERYARVRVAADSVAQPGPSSEDAVTAFSGGVDSTFTLWRHAATSSYLGRRTIALAVLIHGLDIPLDDEAAFRGALARSNRAASDLGIPLSPVRTNFRQVVPREWVMSFGAALAACLHLFKGRCGAALIASSKPYDDLLLPSGSNPITDPLMSGDSFEIVHDGAAFSRALKIEAIGQWRAGVEALRVCWEGPQRDRNCGVCEKCIRTTCSFLASGLPVPSHLGAVPDRTALRRMRLSTDRTVKEWWHVLAAAEAHGITDPWVRTVRWRLRRLAARRAAAATARSLWHDWTPERETIR